MKEVGDAKVKFSASAVASSTYVLLGAQRFETVSSYTGGIHSHTSVSWICNSLVLEVVEKIGSDVSLRFQVKRRESSREVRKRKQSGQK